MFNQLKGAVCGAFGKSKKAAASVALVGLVAAGNASAAVEADFTTALTAIQADTLLYIAAGGASGLAILGVALGWDIGMSTLKKFVKRGAR